MEPAALSLSRTLARLGETPAAFARLQRLLELCPRLPHTATKQRRTKLHAWRAIHASLVSAGPDAFPKGMELPASVRGACAIDERSEEALLALGTYFIEARGAFAATVLPFLLRVYVCVPFFRWRNGYATQHRNFHLYVSHHSASDGDASSTSNTAKKQRRPPRRLSTERRLATPGDSPTEVFTAVMTRLLADVACALPAMRAHVQVAVLASFKQACAILTRDDDGGDDVAAEEEQRLDRHNVRHVIVGMLRALGTVSFPFDLEGAQSMAGLVHSLTSAQSSVMSALVVRVLNQLMALHPTVFPPERVRQLSSKQVHASIQGYPSLANSRFHVHYKSLGTADTAALRDERLDLLLQNVRLGMLCTRADPSLKHQTVKQLMALIKLAVKPKHHWDGSLDVMHATLDALLEVVAEHVELLPDAARALQKLLLGAELPQHPQEKLYGNVLSAAFARMLSRELRQAQSVQSSFTRSVIFSLLNMLYKETNDTRLLLFLTKVARLVNAPTVTEQVLPVVLHRFSAKPKSLHLVVPHLADIAVAGDGRFFDEILSLLLATYSKPFSAENKYNRIEIPIALRKMARRLRVRPASRTVAHMRFPMLKKVLRTTTEIGCDMNERKDDIGVVGAMLPVVVALLQRDPPAAGEKEEDDYDDLDDDAVDGEEIETVNESPGCHDGKDDDKATVEDEDEQFKDLSAYRDLGSDEVLSPQAAQRSLSTGSATGAEPVRTIHVYANTPHNVRWFRRLWYLLVLHKLSTNAGSPTADYAWPDEWLYAVRGIAAESPILVDRSKHRYFEKELDYAAGRLSATPDQLADVRKELMSQVLRSAAGDAAALSDGKVVYLMAVFELESLRVPSRPYGYFYGMLHYLAAEGVKTGGLLPFMGTIADRVFAQYLSFAEKCPNNGARHEALEHHANFLLVSLVSRYEMVRDKAHVYLGQLTKTFPQLQWSKPCVSVLLDLIWGISQTVKNEEALTLDTNAPPLPVVHAQGYKIDLPAQRTFRDQGLELLHTVASSWLQNAQFLVPTTITTILQEYVIATQRVVTDDVHPGIALALSSSAAAPVRVPRLVGGISRKERYIGEIQGMYIVMQGGEHKEPFGKRLSARLTADFQRILAAFSRLKHQQKVAKKTKKNNDDEDDDDDAGSDGKDSRHDDSEQKRVLRELDSTLFRTAALLVWANQELRSDEADRSIDEQELLHLLCKVPTKVFTESALRAATYCWEWLLSSDKRFELPLLVEIKAAWTYTVDNQMGLFSGRVPHVKTAKVVDARIQRVMAPHRLWTEFLVEYFRSIRSFSRDALNILAMILHKAFARPSLLCTARGSFLTRFTLVLLGFWLVQEGDSSLDLRDRELFRMRLFDTGLAWFYQPPQWTEPHTSVPEVEAMADVITTLCKVLDNEEKFWVEQPRLQTSMSRGSLFDHPSATSASAHPRSMSTGSAPEGMAASVAAATMAGTQLAPASMTATRSHRARTAVPSGASTAESEEDSVSIIFHARVSTKLKKQRLLRYRNLFHFLLCHELDRLSAWHNPTRDKGPSKRFKDEGLFTTARHVPPREWQDMVDTAWFHRPELAVRVAQRFPMVAHVTRRLRRAVLSAPESVYDVPEAVRILLDADLSDASLRHLMHWTPCAIPTALELLSPPFAHYHVINEYAVLSLRSHAVEEVVFYLPQLVQSVRHDYEFLLRSYLIEAARTSVLLAHQLIWLCEAELGTETEDEEKKEDAFTTAIAKLIVDIKSSFGAAEKHYFADEFNFFESITKISGVLKPLEVPKDKAATKELRKKRIRKELVKIQVKEALYLPTNPTAEVVEIIPASGTPMQSAAKVPILVAFKCRRSSLVKKAPVVGKSAAAPTEAKRGSVFLSLPSMDDLEDDDDGDGDGDGGDGQEKKVVAVAEDEEKKTEELFTTACIFKVGDDCRQDALALQIISVCKRVFQSVGLDLFLYPYRVLPNNIDNLIGGVIECVPNAMTRDEIGKATACSLKDHFIIKFGREDGAAFQEAQRNFVLSLAGYAIISYLLQVKDRHNGNLMIDDKGHVIHIDFGFIYDISPGRDMRFEKPGFKLTMEMVEIMEGEGIDKPLYKWFVQLILRGFLAVREHMDEIVTLSQAMTECGIGCFKPNSITNLRARFFPDKDERQAASEMLKIIHDAYNNYRTNVYDYIQRKQQNIFYWRGYDGDPPE